MESCTLLKDIDHPKKFRRGDRFHFETKKCLEGRGGFGKIGLIGVTQPLVASDFSEPD